MPEEPAEVPLKDLREFECKCLPTVKHSWIAESDELSAASEPKATHSIAPTGEKKRIVRIASNTHGGIEYCERKICVIRNIPYQCETKTLLEFLASSNFRQDCLEPSETLNLSTSRAVYIFCLGNSASYRIMLRDCVDRDIAMSKIMKGTLDDALSKEFVSAEYAEQYAKNVIRDFTTGGEFKIELDRAHDARIASFVVDSLAHIVKQAKEEDAVLIVPDYTSSSPACLQLQSALNYVDFRGPVINCTLDDWIVCDDESFRAKTYTFEDIDGNVASGTRGVVLDRTTHSFQVAGRYRVRDELPYARFCARLARLIADGPGRAGRGFAVAVSTGGGLAALDLLARAAGEGVPVVVLEGSGRLSDLLPRLYLERFSAGFNAFDKSVELMEACGFRPESNGGAGRQARPRPRSLFLTRHGRSLPLHGGAGRQVSALVQGGDLTIHRLMASRSL